MSKVKKLLEDRNLPPLLGGVKTKDAFEKRQEKIRKLLADRQFGQIPAKPDHMFVEVKSVYDRFACGKAESKKLEFTCE